MTDTASLTRRAAEKNPEPFFLEFPAEADLREAIGR